MARLSDSGEIKPVVKKAWREPTENEDDIEKSIHSLKVRLEFSSISFCAAPFSKDLRILFAQKNS